MTCTILTYRALLETLDRQNIRFKDSEAGGHGEYCWSTKPLCISEKPFFHAYIVIPVNESLANVEFIGLKANLPHHNVTTALTHTMKKCRPDKVKWLPDMQVPFNQLKRAPYLSMLGGKGALLESLDTRNIRFKDCEAGWQGEYCWSTKTLCFSEKHLFHSYIVLPVNESLVNGTFIGLKATFPHNNDILTPYEGPTPLSNLCGVIFDVTGHFTTTKRWPRFCIHVVSPQSTMGNGVLTRCPPFLVIIWESKDRSPTKL
ncbi:hypothetical protein DPEC_G00331890 [Dallia pectoralis]|uniref:Uncharacterized protein n=1 Tax=Dallia pectoralis TaxID=75939 RepID=A0ACC2F603_DALPE|nr:hypothetical protein DPEC_G00331890 [Dallia pectoralis]